MFDFINPGLLWLGLAGISLPIIAHLLSKRRYDVVNWGAMQFLELRQNARRKVLLEQLLLMALRMGLIALLALAFMRPWAEGAWFSKAVSSQNRDVVLIIDGSYSMGWEGGSQTPHQLAVAAAKHVLEDVGSSAAVALIDARDTPRVLIEVPTRDFGLVRETLNTLPAPSGTADLPAAMRKAVQILSRTSNLAREIIVITDRQAKSWRADDEQLWTTYDDLLTQPAVRPRTWVMEVGTANVGNRVNFSISGVELNREVTAVGYPVRVQAKIKSTGNKKTLLRKAFFEVDGQRLADKTQTKSLAPVGDATVEFEYAFSKPGSHRLSLVLQPDNLPGDNRADAVVVVTEAVPVLLVDGDPHPQDLIQSETVFAHSALTPEDNPAPWVQADVVSRQNLDSKLDDLKQYGAVFLANVSRLSDQQIHALSKYTAQGGGVFFALGNKVDAAHYNGTLYNDGNGLLPASLGEIRENQDETKQTVQVANTSLQVSWMQPFTLEADSDLCEARFSHRWTTSPAEKETLTDSEGGRPQSRSASEGESRVSRTDAVSLGEAVVAARLNTGEPFLISRKYGRGRVALMSTAIDADWGTLPAKDDYTPLLHEIVFFLSSSKSNRNVDVGTPLVLELPEQTDVSNHAFFAAGDTPLEFTTGGIVNKQRIIRLDNTSLPGVYAFARKTKEGKRDFTSPAEYFVVNFDRSESDLTSLTDEQRESLAKPGNADGPHSAEADVEPRMTFVHDREEMIAAMLKDHSRSEFWWILLLVFLGILVFEVVMTRRMVQGGHAVDEFGTAALQPDDSGSHGTQPGGFAPPPLPKRRSTGGAPSHRFTS